jgi:hypothetical protein
MFLAALLAAACVPQGGERVLIEQGGHYPGLYVASANLPRQVQNPDLPCASEDARTAGANVVVPWSKFDRGERGPDGERVYDWSWVEAETAPWRERGQKVNLLLWGAAQRTFQHVDGEPATPAYVLAEAPLVRCYRIKNEGPGWSNLSADDPDAEARRDPDDNDVPIHYAPQYLRHYEPAIEAFVRRFEGEPWVNYMRVGIGVGAESYPMNGVPNADGPCRDEWEAAGFTTEVWRAHVMNMIDYLGSLDIQKPFVVTLNKLDGDEALPADMARKAVEEHGFGIGTQGATSRALRQHADPDDRCYAEWCRLFDLYKDRGVVLEVQTPMPSWPAGLGDDGVGTAGHTGPLPEILDFALERGVTSIELYPFEWAVANTEGGRWEEHREAYDEALSRTARTLSGEADGER